MTLAELLEALPPTGLAGVAYPPQLLGAFRRKSITFCSGLTDETTQVYWFQSRSFTIDLRLEDAAATPATERQGWVGDTLWDERSGQLSWHVERSYQPRNQWPEPATFHFIGNSVLEFAPSGAYVEDWRQLSAQGPYLGLRLVGLRDGATGAEIAMAGGFVLAGDHAAYAQSRRPEVDDTLRRVHRLDDALSQGLLSEADIESYEVSLAIDGQTVTHSTQPHRYGAQIAAGAFELTEDGSVILHKTVGAASCQLRFTVDHYVRDFAFHRKTPSTAEAGAWMQEEARHLLRNAVVAS